MLAILAIFQDSPPLASQPSALGTLNTLGLAVFLVGIGILLLMSAHYYRRLNAVKRKYRTKQKHGRADDPAMGGDLVSQLPFMSRQELKEMVLKERSANPAADEAEDAVEAAPLISMPSPVPEQAVGESAKPESSSVKTEEVGEAPVPTPAPPETAREADLLARLAMPSEEEKQEPKEPPKSPYHDLVERSLLSNESLEESKRKSRRI